MSRRTIPMIEVNEILYRWSQGVGKKCLARQLSMSVNTIRDLLNHAEKLGLKRFDSTSEEIEQIALKIKEEKKKNQAQKSKTQNRLSQYHKQIQVWLASPHMTIRQIQRLLLEENALFTESSLSRYIKKFFKPTIKSTLHLETIPGKEAQIDFG